MSDGAVYFQLHAARKVIQALLAGGDPPDVQEAEAAARQWLEENPPTRLESLSAFGHFLTRSGRG